MQRHDIENTVRVHFLSGLADHVVDVLTAADPPGAAGRRSGDRSVCCRILA
jgi:hypothetical protein